jgi:hypothetical protein
MKVIVEKVYQSPSTPVTEVSYLVQFVEMDIENHDGDLMFKLESLWVERLKELNPEIFK